MVQVDQPQAEGTFPVQEGGRLLGLFSLHLSCFSIQIPQNNSHLLTDQVQEL